MAVEETNSDEAGQIYDEVSFQWLAMIYPHETYATYPERFWAFFQKECPGVSRGEMERLLRDAHVMENQNPVRHDSKD